MKILLMLLVSGLSGGEVPNYWTEEGVCMQKNVDLSKYEDSIIMAKVDGKWHAYKIMELPKEFMEWNIKSRLMTLDEVKNRKPPGLAGPHNAAVASYGGSRKDSEFTINNAYKGVGFVPKPEKIEKIITLLDTTWDYGMIEKIEILEGLYKDKELFDRRKQVSLELYTSPDFETHTFLNIMANPTVSLVFLDIPSYELRAIARLIHPKDKTLGREDKNIVKYVNMIHDYFHGRGPRESIVMIFYIIEVFNNTPGNEQGMGQRVVP